MERSENVSYMDMLLMAGRLYCALLCGVVLWKHIQRCDAEGKPYTEIDLNAAAQEADQLMHRFYSRKPQQSDTDRKEAAEDGGFSVTHFDNST